MIKNFKFQISNLESSPGVYLFKDGEGAVLYVGKATSLKSRVGSYFNLDSSHLPPTPSSGRRGSRPIELLIDKVAGLETIKTDSVIEAYFLEQELIKRYQPKYNVEGKDDKSFVYVCVTKEEFPRFVIKRKTDLYKNQKSKIKNQNDKVKIKNERDSFLRVYGPFVARHQAETALKILRKIFPYHSREQKTEKGCLDFQLGFCPGPFAGKISKGDYAKNIRAIEAIFRGKKKALISKLEKEMGKLAKEQKFEKAAERRNQVFALRHIQDVAMLGESAGHKLPAGMNEAVRIEAFDISHISGEFVVASMVVFDNSADASRLLPNKGQYRKFKIKSFLGNDDVRAMGEVLARRFGNDWEKPTLLVVDGGKGQVNVAQKVLDSFGLEIPILGVAKGPTRKAPNFKFQTCLPTRQVSNKFQIPKVQKELIKHLVQNKNILGQITDEAHRFAIGYHRKLRSKKIGQDNKKKTVK